MADTPVRVRFCPSPTGNPHVGLVRTALFNWAYARHTGGTFVFRIEDTDAARDSEDSYLQLLDSLRWLGLDWDEGPEVGGPYGPYRQSERMGIYAQVAKQLLDAGFAYECFCTPEELEAARVASREAGSTPGYPGTCRDLDPSTRERLREAGRQPAIRFRMPGTDWTWDDLIRGPITFTAEHVPDYVLVRANGDPLYTLVNPVDDAMMRITHVLRGEDLLSSTPRQLALFEALIAIGVADAVPRYGHLPYVMGEGNRKLSKRDPESSLRMYRHAGYLPEGLLNYLALLGWSMGEDREFFSPAELASAFTLDRVSENPARFDLRKCTAINADWIRALPVDELISRLTPSLATAGLVGHPPSETERAVLHAAVPLIHERIQTLGEATEMLSFLLVDPQHFAIDDADAVVLASAEARQTLAAAREALAELADPQQWTAEHIEASLRAALIDGLGLKPKTAFTAVRVAVTGRRISPPLFESCAILGKQATMARLGFALAPAV